MLSWRRTVSARATHVPPSKPPFAQQGSDGWRFDLAHLEFAERPVAFAEALGLDMDRFNSCFQANRYREEISQDKSDGQQAGVTGTPSVFVDGQQLTPGFVPSYQDIAAAVDDALASSGG